MPIFLRDTYGSTVSVMLFPDDMKKAKNRHVRQLSRGAMQAYIKAGHSFKSRDVADFGDNNQYDRDTDFHDANSCADVSQNQVMARLRGASLVADTLKVLWALICDGNSRAGWERAIEIVCDATPTGEAGSPSHIRKQLSIFAPVMHLWLGWKLSDEECPPETEFFHIGYPILLAVRAWAETRPEAFRRADSYLSVREFGPWKKLAREMELRGGYPRILSLRQGLQKNL